LHSVAFKNRCILYSRTAALAARNQGSNADQYSSCCRYCCRNKHVQTSKQQLSFVLFGFTSLLGAVLTARVSCCTKHTSGQQRLQLAINAKLHTRIVDVAENAANSNPAGTRTAAVAALSQCCNAGQVVAGSANLLPYPY
jgi:hypothetical protein